MTSGPACKTQVEKRQVYLGPIEISSDLSLSMKGVVIEHPYWPLKFLAVLHNS